MPHSSRHTQTRRDAPQDATRASFVHGHRSLPQPLGRESGSLDVHSCLKARYFKALRIEDELNKAAFVSYGPGRVSRYRDEIVFRATSSGTRDQLGNPLQASLYATSSYPSHLAIPGDAIEPEEHMGIALAILLDAGRVVAPPRRGSAFPCLGRRPPVTATPLLDALACQKQRRPRPRTGNIEGIRPTIHALVLQRCELTSFLGAIQAINLNYPSGSEKTKKSTINDRTHECMVA
ncbi:hypothetical protein B0H21DRAFT_710217 [Amylocystis lapponica]|nr:hypothetical protein B0H21DRAFT_710217 [Amylocystis lapponica]